MIKNVGITDYRYETRADPLSALRAPTVDLWLEILKSRKFVIQGFICITKF